MRILILGAGGIGAYFGARLHAAGGDVTFLVRPARAENLREHGLRIFSPFGNYKFKPNILTNAEPGFDVIFLACKAYDLDSAMLSINRAVGTDTVIVPLLNGIRHLDTLDGRFGQSRVLGGLAHLSLMMSPDGSISHLNNFHRLMIGNRSRTPSGWLEPLAQLFGKTDIEFTLSADIEQEMWSKFVFISTLAGATCAMRANVGEILATERGEAFILGLLDECEQVAGANKHAPAAAQLAAYRSGLTDRASTLCASMLRDIERGGLTEAEHILGDMVQRGEKAGIATPHLNFAYTHLQAYEQSRQRLHPKA